MNSRIVSVIALLAALAAWVPAAAEAKVSAAITIETKDGASRLVAVLSSDRALTERSRPVRVIANAGGRTYLLTGSGTMNARELGTWRSGVATGKAARALRGLVGRKITLRLQVRSRPGAKKPGGDTKKPGRPTTPGTGEITTTGPVVPAPENASTGGDGSQSSTPPGFADIKSLFLNSRFTDCVPGWPACGEETRYVHCADFGWQHRRLTGGVADVTRVGSLSVVDAALQPDGSWGVAYLSRVGSGDDASNFSFYVWEVSPTGAATGYYWASAASSPVGGEVADPDQVIGPLQHAPGAPDC